MSIAPHSSRIAGKVALFLLSIVLFFSGAERGVAEVGEFPIRGTTPLGPEQLEKLRALADNDPEAQKLAAEAREAAIPLLDATPQPIEVIHYEGLVNTDPKRIETVSKLREMDDAAALVRYWQLTGDEKAAETLRKFILAWATTYKPTGNDVNENKFYPLFVGYQALRPTFEPADQEKVDAWIEEIAELHASEVRSSDHLTNRYTKRLRMLALFSEILDRPEWKGDTEAGIRRFVDNSLFADGTSHDLKRRDTLTYHMSSLKPVIQLCILSGDKGAELYRWTGKKGGSLEKSVNYVIPYATGEKTREEWKNSKAGLDKRRAEAGLEKYRPGSLFDPSDALEMMEQASFFDPELTEIVVQLTDSDAERFPTWRMLMNAAARPE